jgi:two-component system, sensor histidine kinase PdtaS
MAPAAPPELALNLALAIIESANAPLLLLDGALNVVAASSSFCRAFEIDPADVEGKAIYALGHGEWNLPRLHALLDATASGAAAIPAYELDLTSERHGVRRLVLNAHKLDYVGSDALRLLLSLVDVTDARLSDKLKDDLLREKAVLLQEVQHRVANSLQIIASVLMQSARKVVSEESREHLRDAHHRVLSIAAVQKQLATSQRADVELRGYLTQLCQSIGASMIHDHDQLRIDVCSDDSVVQADVSMSLGLVVTELVINALKHGFPDARSGRIEVGYAATGSDWRLTVSDDGIGMPPASAPAKGGLGTSIVEALARQLQARIDVTAAHPGTRVSLTNTAPHISEDAENVVPLTRAV